MCTHPRLIPLHTDRIHKEEGFWKGREGAQVGTCSEDAPRAPGTRAIHLREQDDLQ